MKHKSGNRKSRSDECESESDVSHPSRSSRSSTVQVGPTGPTGAAGKNGAQGPVGPQGQPGKNGAQGPIGPAGPQGPTGSTICCLNVFGCGADGDFTYKLDDEGTIPTIYVLPGDVYYHNLTIDENVILNTNGYRVFVSGILKLHGIITNSGENGLSGKEGGDGGSGATAGSVGSSTISADGGKGGSDVVVLTCDGLTGSISTTITDPTAGGDSPLSVCPKLCSITVGASGGSVTPALPGSARAGAAGGDLSFVSEDDGGVNILCEYPPTKVRTLSGSAISGGVGGGGGGAAINTFAGAFPVPAGVCPVIPCPCPPFNAVPTVPVAYGGGGGGGGGVVVVVAQKIVGDGSIQSNGGNGGAGYAHVPANYTFLGYQAAAGGGGGGDGGIIVLVTLCTPPDSIKIVARGGTGGKRAIAGKAISDVSEKLVPADGVRGDPGCIFKTILCCNC